MSLYTMNKKDHKLYILLLQYNDTYIHNFKFTEI